MVKKYLLTIGDYTRTLDIVPIDEHYAMAAFVLLGDARMTHEAARLLTEKMPSSFDYIVTPESMGIPLAHEISVATLHPEYIILRKSVKVYMKNELSEKYQSFENGQENTLYLDGIDADRLKGKKVALVDDVISSGNSMEAAENLMKKAGARVVGKLAILAEGEAVNRKDITVLEGLPLFEVKPDGEFEPIPLD
ncbi:MAG: adenine phosphoribosyltransferase [Lactobacillaceae bacterium]|nr:adenine phosphoribosyltransferase [Lactobacillaceae bacterium]